MKKAQVTIQ